LKILQRLGVNLFEVAPVLVILDTNLIAQNLLGASFKLGALLAELKCPYKSPDLHNAWNDANFTLHAMLMLTVKSSESREMGLQSEIWNIYGQ
jgi:hypothetical protein